MTNGNEPVVATIYRQVGKETYRPATQKEINEGIYLVHKEGLTKREYFAASALQGLLSNPELTKTHDEVIAMTCIDAVDALINALNKTEK